MQQDSAQSHPEVTFPANLPKLKNKTRSLSGHSVKRQWLLIDAADLVLGRLAAFVAHRLRGKHRADYTPNVNCGDHVIIINAEKVCLTGKKEHDKVYHRHTGYPGGIKTATASMVRNGKNPQNLLKLAIKRMLDKGPLANKQMSRLRVYCDDQNPHSAQVMQVLDFARCNRKNTRSSS